METHPQVQISQIHLLSSFEASFAPVFPPLTDPFLSFTIFTTGYYLGFVLNWFWEVRAHQGCQGLSE